MIIPYFFIHINCLSLFILIYLYEKVHKKMQKIIYIRIYKIIQIRIYKIIYILFVFFPIWVYNIHVECNSLEFNSMNPNLR